MANITKMLSSKQEKLILSVGDEGAILTHFKGKILIKRLFCPSPSSNVLQEFKKYFFSFPKVPVYLLVDVLDQTYLRHALPPVSSLNLKSLIRRRLDRDFPPDDIKAAIPISDAKSEKERQFLFVSLRNAPPFSEWLQAVDDIPNPLLGISLLPVESEGFIRDLRKALTNKFPREKQSEWQLLVSHHRLGGFRLVAIKDNRIIFTRIAQPVGGPSPSIVAGNIEQEVVNTLEYIRRLSYDEASGLDIYILASQEVKRQLDLNKFHVRFVVALTPFEVADFLNLGNVAEADDKFSDVVLAAHYATKKSPLLLLHTRHSISARKSYLGQKSLFVISLISCLALTIFIYSALASVITLNLEISKLEKEKSIIDSSIEKIKTAQATLPEDPDTVIESVTIHQALSIGSKAPIEVISKVSEIVNSDYMLVKNVALSFTEVFIEKDGRKIPNDSLRAEFDLEFRAVNKSQEALIKEMNEFSTSTYKAFEPLGLKADVISPQPDASIKIEFSQTASKNVVRNFKLVLSGDISKIIHQGDSSQNIPNTKTESSATVKTFPTPSSNSPSLVPKSSPQIKDINPSMKPSPSPELPRPPQPLHTKDNIEEPKSENKNEKPDIIPAKPATIPTPSSTEKSDTKDNGSVLPPKQKEKLEEYINNNKSDKKTSTESEGEKK